LGLAILPKNFESAIPGLQQLGETSTRTLHIY
jgi:hypothetical protein